MIDDQREISGEVGSDRRSARDKWGASAELDDSPEGRSMRNGPGGGGGGEEMEPRVVGGPRSIRTASRSMLDDME